MLESCRLRCKQPLPLVLPTARERGYFAARPLHRLTIENRSSSVIASSGAPRGPLANAARLRRPPIAPRAGALNYTLLKIRANSQRSSEPRVHGWTHAIDGQPVNARAATCAALFRHRFGT